MQKVSIPFVFRTAAKTGHAFSLVSALLGFYKMRPLSRHVQNYAITIICRPLTWVIICAIMRAWIISACINFHYIAESKQLEHP